jgi:hypothetical protein
MVRTAERKSPLIPRGETTQSRYPENLLNGANAESLLQHYTI